MHALPYAGMPGTIGRLLEQPGLPMALRGLRKPPQAGVTYRAREPADALALFSLFSEPAFRDGALTRDAFETPHDLEIWLSTIAGPSRSEVVAWIDGHLVGFAGLYPQADHMSHVGSLMLGVTTNAQGRGIGAFLLQLMIWTAWAVEGLAKVQLTVFSDNSRAVRLYRSAGFEIEGTLRQFVRCDGQTRDAYAMALFLE